mmetsp:Transcript_20591/g.58363  ORF Transcript_20591/g.58363 Transcript_20591/m.58363 type:complete len:259 (-) Transcript_20591:487-1263(-)
MLALTPHIVQPGDKEAFEDVALRKKTACRASIAKKLRNRARWQGSCTSGELDEVLDEAMSSSTFACVLEGAEESARRDANFEAHAEARIEARVASSPSSALVVPARAEGQGGRREAPDSAAAPAAARCFDEAMSEPRAGGVAPDIVHVVHSVVSSPAVGRSQVGAASIEDSKPPAIRRGVSEPHTARRGLFGTLRRWSVIGRSARVAPQERVGRAPMDEFVGVVSNRSADDERPVTEQQPEPLGSRILRAGQRWRVAL